MTKPDRVSKTGPASDRQLRRRERNRQAILEAARYVIERKGIDAATMQEITDRADVGAGTIYNYFDSKQDLLGSIVSEELANLVIVVQSAASAIGNRPRAAAGAYGLTLERLATDVIWGHLLHQPKILGDTIYKAHKMAGETDLFAARSRYLPSAHSGKLAIELAWWQTVGTLVALAQAARDGYLFCDETFLREATGNMLRMNGVPENEIRELLAEAPMIFTK